MGFIGFLSALALLGFLIGLRLQFGWTGAARIQPFVAVLLGPAAYLGFRALMQEDWDKRALIWHGGAVLLAIIIMALPARRGHNGL